LLVVLLGLVVSLLDFGVGLSIDIPEAFRLANLLPNSDPQLPLILLEIAIGVFICTLAAALLVLFFLSHRAFPKLMLLWVSLPPLLELLRFGLATRLMSGDLHAPSPLQLGAIALAPAIWIPYILRSRRVKNTFVNPRRPGA
jgi:hypothetical protein